MFPLPGKKRLLGKITLSLSKMLSLMAASLPSFSYTCIISAFCRGRCPGIHSHFFFLTGWFFVSSSNWLRYSYKFWWILMTRQKFFMARQRVMHCDTGNNAWLEGLFPYSMGIQFFRYMEDQPPDGIRERPFNRTLVWPLEPHRSETAKTFGPGLAGHVPELPENRRGGRAVPVIFGKLIDRSKPGCAIPWLNSLECSPQNHIHMQAETNCIRESSAFWKFLSSHRKKKNFSRFESWNFFLPYHQI